MSLAAWIPSSLRFFSICFDLAIAARSSADDVHPIFLVVSLVILLKNPIFAVFVCAVVAEKLVLSFALVLVIVLCVPFSATDPHYLQLVEHWANLTMYEKKKQSRIYDTIYVYINTILKIAQSNNAN